jgi:hypothetical protein
MTRPAHTPGTAMTPGEIALPTTTHRFTQPGTYFVSLRVTADRDGDISAQYAALRAAQTPGGRLLRNQRRAGRPPADELVAWSGTPVTWKCVSPTVENP